MNRSSKRFSPSKLAEWLVPAILALLFLGLIATMVIILISH
jgi:hypothetical protein